MDQRVLSQVLLRRIPEFVRLVISETTMMTAGGLLPAPSPGPRAFTPEDIAYRRALEMAGETFTQELCMNGVLPDPQQNLIVYNFPEDAAIISGGRPFSKRHFARNYQLQFQQRVGHYFAQINRPLTGVSVSPDGSSITLTLAPQHCHQDEAATPSSSDSAQASDRELS